MIRRAWALLALQTRLSLRTWSHGKTIGTIIGSFVILLAAGGAFAGGYGLYVFSRSGLMDARPLIRLVMFDGFVLGFLVLTLWGLLMEAQRGDLLDLRKLMHLPVSPGIVFTINYLYSLLSPGLLFYVPAAMGITLGLREAIGARAFLFVPLFVLFYFALSAWTYHARGWVAILLQDRRKRRMLAVLIPVLVILVSQSPALVRFAAGGDDAGAQPRKFLEDPVWVQRIYDVNVLAPPLWLALGAQQILNNTSEFAPPPPLVSPRKTSSVPAAPVDSMAPLGVMNEVASPGPPAAMPVVGLFLLGALGIAAGYTTTLRYYRRGGAAAGQGRENVKPQRRALTQRGHLFLSGQSAALTWAFLLDYARHPAVRSQMVMPPLMTLILCASILMQREAGGWERDAVPLFVLLLPFLGSTMMLFNIFGTDRQGFRALMLMPAARHRILLAKNMALFPFMVAQCVLTIGLGAILLNVPLHIVALQALQVPAAYCLFCVAGNILSVYAPTPMSRDALRAHGSRLMLLVRGIAYAAFTVAAFLPSIGILTAASLPGELAAPPVWIWSAALGYLAFTLLVYRLALTHTGDLLTAHEQKILAALSQETA